MGKRLPDECQPSGAQLSCSEGPTFRSSIGARRPSPRGESRGKSPCQHCPWNIGAGGAVSASHRNSAGQTVSSLPHGDVTCVSYLPGHHVHHIPVLRYAAERTFTAGHLEFTHDVLRLFVGGEAMPVSTHNTQALRELVEQIGGSCRWYPSLNYACWPDGNLRHWVNLSLAGLTPCVSQDKGQSMEWEAWT